MKANSTAGVLQVLARLGAGVDTVSGGEIARALRAGFRPEKIVYSGVGKTAREITFALKAGIGCFNVESEPELERINRIATELGVRAPISIRCNPDVDPKTHPYISTGLKNNKFGIAIADVEDIYLRAANMPGIEVKGIDAHIGSQITEIQPYLDSVHRLLDTMSALRDQGSRAPSPRHGRRPRHPVPSRGPASHAADLRAPCACMMEGARLRRRGPHGRAPAARSWAMQVSCSLRSNTSSRARRETSASSTVP